MRQDNFRHALTFKFGVSNVRQGDKPDKEEGGDQHKMSLAYTVGICGDHMSDMYLGLEALTNDSSNIQCGKGTNDPVINPEPLAGSV